MLLQYNPVKSDFSLIQTVFVGLLEFLTLSGKNNPLKSDCFFLLFFVPSG